MSRYSRLMAGAVFATLWTVHAAVAPSTHAAAPPASRPAAAAPATQDAADDTEALRIIIAEVKGLAQVREGPDRPWKMAKVDMEVGRGAEFRTASRSSVTCVIPPDQVITLDRLGTFSVMEAMRSGRRVKTDLLMRYGRTDYTIEAAGREHDAQIHTPSATLAVRGTRFVATDQPPFAPEVYTQRGLVDYRFARRLMRVSRGGRARGARGQADTALTSGTVDPAIRGARTTSDTALIANEQSRGAVVAFDPVTEINVARGGRGPATDADLLDALPGRLNFVLRWDRDADVNLTMVHQAGDPLEVLADFRPEEFLYPGFRQNTTPSGGRTEINHLGGAAGGQEIAHWGNAAPRGLYAMEVLHVRGDATPVTMNAFLDGQPLPLTALTFDENGNVITRPQTLPDGTVIDLPVLEVANQITRNLQPRREVSATIDVPPTQQVPPAAVTRSTAPRASAAARGPAAAGPEGRGRAAANGADRKRAAVNRVARLAGIPVRAGRLDAGLGGFPTAGLAGPLGQKARDRR